MLNGGCELIIDNVEFLELALLAKLLGRPVVFYGIEVAMRNASWLGHLDSRLALPRCDRFLVWDDSAAEALRRLGVAQTRIAAPSGRV